MSQLSLYSPPVNTSRLVSKVTQNVLTSPEIAIVELIANAWDAGATTVNIHWPEDDHDFFSIEDNGIGMTDDDFKNHWCHIGYNRRQVQQSQITIQILQDGKKLSITRATYGKNGIGKFAAFCFASKIKITTINENNKNEYILTQNVDDCLFKYKKETSNTNTEKSGTKIVSISRKHINCTKNRIINYLSQRFICLPYFDIYINGEKIDINSLQENNFQTTTIEIDTDKIVRVSIIERDEIDRDLRWSGIAWIVNGRRVGDCSWELPSSRFVDGRTDISKKYLICVYADFLSEFINEDWTAFDETSDLYNDTLKKVSEFIKSFFESVNNKKTSAKISSIRQKTGLITQHLSIISKEKVDEFITNAVYKCPSINESDFEHLVKILSTLETTKNKYSILSRLALLSHEDWDKLDEIMREWTIAVAKDVLDEIQHRLTLIEQLKKLTSNDNTYEVQELQPMIEQCLWMFGPEYESIEYTSNQSIANCFRKYMGRDATQPTTRNRPDFTIIPDGAISFYSTPEYDEIEANEVGINRLVIVELKAPGVNLGRKEKSQPLKYYDEFLSIGLISDNTRVTAFVVGSKKDSKLNMSPSQENGITVHIMLFSTLLERAESRMLRLRSRFDLASRAPFLQE